MILHLYFARKFAMAFTGLLVVFALLYALLDMVEIIQRFDEATFVEVLTLTALNMPQGLYTILPLITIIATLALFLNLARTSELVIVRASGRSALQSLVSPLAVATLIGFLAVGVFNPIVAATSRQYDVLASKYSKSGRSILSVSREGLWLRQSSVDGQTVIRADRANADGTEMSDVSFIVYDGDGQPYKRIEARSAALQEGAWAAVDAKQWLIEPGQIPEKTATVFAELNVPTDLTRDQIRDGFGTPASIPIWELPGFIERLDNAGFSARRHRVWFHTELSQPLVQIAMLLIGAAFTMRHTRFGRTGQMVTMAVLMGFGFHFIRSLAQSLGESGQLPVVLAAWAPPVAAIFLALGLLLHLEDG